MIFSRHQLIISLFISLTLLAGCKSTEPATEPQPTAVDELANMMEGSDVFSQTITGFVLHDPEADSTLYGVNDKKYMTPASNTKLFTFYAGLNTLGEEAPALKYVTRGDSLIFWGTGDPSFMHPDFDNEEVYEFLKEREEKLYFSEQNYDDEPLGPGWSWADYDSYYSTEKSPLPMYGNIAEFTIEEITLEQIAKKDGEYEVEPAFFSKFVEEKERKSDRRSLLKRKRVGNEYRYLPRADTSRQKISKPFHYSAELTVDMLADTLGRDIKLVDKEIPEVHKVLHSQKMDTLYKKMLQPSDNFIAEQILLMISSTLEKGDRLNSQQAIEHAKNKFLDDLPDDPQWRDGSGLSRYNLFTPRSMVALLQKINKQVDDQQLFDMLPTGGESGTIRDLYAHREGGLPYVFAKTGTLNNNHSLSGYVLTESGRKLIFSFMNNNYTLPTGTIQSEMEKVLWFIHKNF